MYQVDDGYRTWRKPSLLLFGASDPFISVKSAFDFLESKRTNMRLATASAKVRVGTRGGAFVFAGHSGDSWHWALLLSGLVG